MSRTVFSALSGMRLLACLIVAPQRGYDEPATLSYAISSFCPTSADGLHNVTPHVAQNTTNRLSAIDGRTVRHCGYEVSQQKRKRVEEPFGWGKTIGGLARPMLRGVKKLDFKFTLTMAAYDLIKLPRLIGATA